MEIFWTQKLELWRDYQMIIRVDLCVITSKIVFLIAEEENKKNCNISSQLIPGTFFDSINVSYYPTNRISEVASVT